jgi:hypothetical protein
MRLFQAIAIPFIAAMLIVSLRTLFKGRGRTITPLAWMLLWLGSLVAVRYPETTTKVAQAVGIGRGADLLLYLAVLASIVGFSVMSRRMRQMAREITLLTREVALLDAERKQNGTPDGPA